MAIVVDTISSGPPYGSNCYLVREGDGRQGTVAIDPGGSAQTLVRELERVGSELAGILVTHGDIDHVAGVAELAALTGAEVWMPAGETDVLANGLTRDGSSVSAHEVEHPVRSGERIALAGLEFEVVAVPGHSSDHVAFLCEGALFSGDLLFIGTVGRSDLPGGNHLVLMHSIAGLLKCFEPDLVLYPGHGDATTLAAELEHNPFLAPLRG